MRERTQQTRDAMYKLRDVVIHVTMEEPHGSHRSYWTTGKSVYTNMDHSRSWKGNTFKNPPEWSGVAVYVHGMSNHASVEQYVALFNSITGGLIFVRPNRNEDGSLQGTMVVQYKTRDQADKLLAGLVPDAKHRVEGKIVLSDRSCYEYLVEEKDVTDNAQYYLLDPLGRECNMYPDQGKETDIWFTGRWVTNCYDEDYNKGQAGDLCRRQFPDEPLEWVHHPDFFLTPAGYHRKNPSWLAHMANHTHGKPKQKRNLTFIERQ